MNSRMALDRLLEGNRRFVAGQRVGVQAQWQADRMSVSQEPFAAVLGCSDSRVPLELIFDLGPGEAFVVRVAGNIAGSSELGSLEYAVQYLGVSLVMVLGHEKCGAVKAALDGGAVGAVADVVNRIRPAITPLLEQVEEPQELWMEAVRANVRKTVDDLVRQSPVIAEAVRKGTLSIEGALFSFGTGRVSILVEKG